MLVLLHVFSRRNEYRVFEKVLSELNKMCKVEYMGLGGTVWGGFSTRDYATLSCVLQHTTDILNINGIDMDGGFTYSNRTEQRRLSDSLNLGYYSLRYIPHKIDHLRGYRYRKRGNITPILPQLILRKEEIPKDMASFLIANHHDSLQITKKERDSLDKLFHGTTHLYKTGT